MPQEDYLSKYDAYDKEYKKIIKEISKLQLETQRKKTQSKFLQNFINNLETRPLILEMWDEDIWTYLSRVESGKQNLTVETLIRICECLDITLKEFFDY